MCAYRKSPPPGGTSDVPARARAGFSIVEVMVASLILGLVVSAIAAMAMNSSLLKSINSHNRQARIICQEELEDPAHHYRNYALAGNLGGTLQMDLGEPGNPLTVSRSVVVTPGVTPQYQGVAVAYKSISSMISWTEDGQARSVTLYKRITDIP